MIHDYRYIEEEVAKDIPYDPAHIRVSSDCLDEFNWKPETSKGYDRCRSWHRIVLQHFKSNIC